MTRRTKTYVLIIGGALAVILGIPAWCIFGPARALVISKATTYLTEPLTADGDVDYVEAVIERRRKGVTPENNGAVLLLQATWPYELDPEEQTLICDELGIPQPTATGLVGISEAPEFESQITAWASEKWGVDLSDETEYDFSPDEYLFETQSSPWRRADVPPLAQWIDAHAVQFELLHQMEQREKCYFPSPDYFASDRTLMSDNSADLILFRQAARNLSTRAMMHIGEGEPRLAWRDLRMIFVLSRKSPTVASTINRLVSYVMADIAVNGCERLLSRGQCDRALLDEMDEFFANQPPIGRIATALDEMDRWMILEHSAYGSPTEFVMLEPDFQAGFVQLLGLPLDRNALMQRINQRMDELVAVSRLEDPVQCAAVAEAFESDLNAARHSWNDWKLMAAATISQSARGVYAADMLASWALPDVAMCKSAEFRILTTEQLLRVAVALEKYRLTNGNYPDSLQPLSELLDPMLLDDTCSSGNQLRYERRGDGFLLYSRFENGIDDGGNHMDGKILQGEWASEDEHLDDYRNVDIVFRFPMPPLIFSKPISHSEDEAEYDRLMALEEEEFRREEEAAFDDNADPKE